MREEERRSRPQLKMPEEERRSVNLGGRTLFEGDESNWFVTREEAKKILIKDGIGEAAVDRALNSLEKQARFLPETEKETTVAKTEAKAGTKKIDVAEVVRHGQKLIVPETMDLHAAIKVLEERIAYDKEVVGVGAFIDCFLFEGAYALASVLSDRFGWVRGVPTPGFFGPEPPQMLAVPVGRNRTTDVPWGRMRIEALGGGFLTAGGVRSGKRLTFSISGEVKRAYQETVNEIIQEVRERVARDSLYRGQAFKVAYRDEDGDWLPIPQPTFLNLDLAPRPEELIFRRTVARAIDTNIFTPIRHTDAVRAAGVPIKRGVLLSGPYGTGKTMVATATARLAVDHGWTFIECSRADDLPQVLRLAQSYGRSVVFCEDVDQVLRGDRDIDMNEILNTIDGVDAKSSEVLVVLTTNHVDDITPAMLRPGRLDAVIEVQKPDAEAAEALIRLYGKDLIPAGEDLTEVGRVLEDQIPSIIRDVVEVSKLHSVSLSGGKGKVTLTREALLEAAESKQHQIKLVREKEREPSHPTERAARDQRDGMLAIAAALTGGGGLSANPNGNALSGRES